MIAPIVPIAAKELLFPDDSDVSFNALKRALIESWISRYFFWATSRRDSGFCKQPIASVEVEEVVEVANFDDSDWVVIGLTVHADPAMTMPSKRNVKVWILCFISSPPN